MPLYNGKLRDFQTEPARKVNPAELWTFFFPSFHRILQSTVNSNAFLVAWATDTELTPEFFSCPECFTGLPLPAFCKNEFEFVYFLRAFLESEFITQTIHLWLSLTFGQPHPPRGVLSMNAFDPTGIDVLPFSQGDFISSMFVLIRNDQTICGVSESGQEIKNWKIPFPEHFVNVEDAFLLFDKGKVTHMILKTELACDIKLDINIRQIQNCGDLVAICTIENEIVVFKFPSILSRVSLVTETAKCFFASSQFNRLVIGTRSGKLLIFSIPESTVLRSVQLSIEPEKILITAGFGFIFVYGRGSFIVFTINGSKICEGKLDLNVLTCSPFTNIRGFDFVLLLDEKFIIHVIEVFNLRVMTHVFGCSSPIGILKYDGKRSGIVAARYSGRAFFVPFIPTETFPDLS
jgi:hypothetical protein